MFVKFLEVESTPALPAPKLPVYDIKPLSAPPPGRGTTNTPASGMTSHKNRFIGTISVISLKKIIASGLCVSLFFNGSVSADIGYLNVHDNFPYFYV